MVHLYIHTRTCGPLSELFDGHCYVLCTVYASLKDSVAGDVYGTLWGVCVGRYIHPAIYQYINIKVSDYLIAKIHQPIIWGDL